MSVKTVRDRVVGGENVIDTFLDAVQRNGVALSVEQAEVVSRRMREMMGYQPKIGFFGKTGVGKSSLCNALFGRDVAPVSNVAACTRNANEYILTLGGTATGIVLVDVPGVGESIERDEEYSALYRELIPKLDVLVWVVKADDRAFTIEERFHKDVVQEVIGSVPLVVAINQADKIEPVRDWLVAERRPGPKQEPNLALKCDAVRAVFGGVRRQRVIPVSAVEGYELGTLLEAVVEAVPRSKRLGVVREASEEAATPKAKESAENGFWEETWATVKRFAREVAPDVVVAAAKATVVAFLRWLRS